MHLRVVRRRIKNDHKEKFSKEIRSHKFPNPADAKGIKAYYVIDTAPDEVTTVSIFDTQEDMAEWTRICQESFSGSTSKGFLSEDPEDITVISGAIKEVSKNKR